MKRSLFFKIFAGFFLITFVLTIYILLFSFRTVRSYVVKVTGRELANTGAALLASANPLLADGKLDELNRLISSIGRDTGKRITIIDAEGTVLADSEEEPSKMENHGNRPEMLQALSGQVGTALRYSRTIREEMLYAAIPIITGDGEEKIIGALRVSIFMRELNAQMKSIERRILLVSAVIVVLSLIGAFLFSSTILNPVRQLTEAARRVAGGDFNARVFLRHENELKVLADSYNFMTEKIRSYVSELSGQKEELRTIISSIQPALLVIGRDSRITLSNGSAGQLFHSTGLDGKVYWEVIDAPEIFKLVQEVQSSGKSGSLEVQMSGGWYQAGAAFIEPMHETVLILSDITELKNLEKIKRDFVMNVSHELRTPLTAIKGYAETIEGVSDENKKYLDVIKRHTERLINVVQDLLLLSELEERGSGLVKEQVHLEEIASQVLRMFEDRIVNKGLRCGFTVQGTLPPVPGDSLRMEQLFINLIDNAVKYTDKGEIALNLRSDSGGVELSVQDTGIGIPEQHLPRIFERFYTVDKSRSRKLGGTGLGLAIVKHIVLLHGGTISVESTPGAGTKFSVRFPVLST